MKYTKLLIGVSVVFGSALAVSQESFMDAANVRIVTPYQRTYDLRFIEEMSRHHSDGIAMAEIAVTKANQPALQEMAKKMIEDQKKEIRMMRQMRLQWFPSSRELHVPSGMTPDGLKGVAGRQFDLVFLETMINHHMGGIFLGREGAEKGNHVQLKNLAEKIAQAQLKELANMRAMRDRML